MAAENFTGEEETTTIAEFLCSAELRRQVYNHLIILPVLHIFVFITAVLGNTLILIALYKENSLHRPSKVLYCNLAIADLCVGITAVPLAVLRFMIMMKRKWNICRIVFDSNFIISYSLGGVSLLTTTTISLDRLLALVLGLRYRQVVTLKKTYATVTTLWFVAIVSAATHLFNTLITSWCGNIAILLCVVISIVSHTKIFLTLHHNKIRVQSHISLGQPSQAFSLNKARYRKAVSSALWVQITQVVCYLPYFIAVTLMTREGFALPPYLAREYTTTLVFVNSSLNPMLYCWKIREVREAMKEIIRPICCLWSKELDTLSFSRSERPKATSEASS